MKVKLCYDEASQQVRVVAGTCQHCSSLGCLCDDRSLGSAGHDLAAFTGAGAQMLLDGIPILGAFPWMATVEWQGPIKTGGG